MRVAWIIGFAFGSSLAWWVSGWDLVFPNYCPPPLLHVAKVIAMACLFLISKTAKSQSVFRILSTLTVATFFSFLHFDRSLHFGLFAGSPEALQRIKLTGISELGRLDPYLADWINSIVWGDTRSIAPQLRRDFKVSGLYHILSVSGSHVSTLVVLLRFTMIAPAWVLYTTNLLPGHAWYGFKGLLPLLTVPVLLAYLQAIGCPQAAARATFLAICHMVLVNRHANASAARRCLLTIVFQSLFVPEEFFSFGNLMSWMGYLCILDCMQTKKSWLTWEFCSKVFLMQLELLGWSVACFGQLSLIGIPANFLLAPIFAPVFWGAIVLALFPKTIFFAPLSAIQTWFLRGVTYSASAAEAWPWLYLAGDQIHYGVRWAVALSCTWIVIRRLVTLSNQSDNQGASKLVVSGPPH